MSNHKIIVFDSDTNRHQWHRGINESSRIEEQVFNCNDTDIKSLITNKTGAELKSLENNTEAIKTVSQKYIPPNSYDLIFIHINNLFARDYIKQFGNKHSIVVFSGGGVTERFTECLVSVVSFPLNTKDTFESLNWKAAFDKFEKGKPFPVHLLKPSLQNTYALLILLQGYIAANFPEDKAKNKLLPGWDTIKNKVSIKNPEQTKSPDWWDIIKKDDLLREIQTSGKDKVKIEKSVNSIEDFFRNISSFSDDTLTAVYTDLKDLLR